MSENPLSPGTFVESHQGHPSVVIDQRANGSVVVLSLWDSGITVAAKADECTVIPQEELTFYLCASKGWFSGYAVDTEEECIAKYREHPENAQYTDEALAKYWTDFQTSPEWEAIRSYRCLYGVS